jgi:hypothetical protein
LFRDGNLNYYKDESLYRGTIKLCKDTKVIKAAKEKFEIQCPYRTYFLTETETERLVTDIWIDKIRQVIENLK